MFIQNRRNTNSYENSYALAFEGNLCSGDLYCNTSYSHQVGIFCLSLPPSRPLSVCLSRFLDSGVETVRGIGTKISGWTGPPGGRVLLHFSSVRDARGTWHVLPRKGLQKFVGAVIGQKRETDDSKFAGHACTIPICALFWLLGLWGAGCTLQGRKNLMWGPPVQGNFELETPNSVGGQILAWCTWPRTI